MKSLQLLLATCAVAATLAHGQAPARPAPPAVAATASMAEGEVRKIDKDAKKMTLRHGPIANLDMPAMTMVFRVADPAMLEQVQPGDKVRFKADRVEGQMTVTAIEPLK